MTASAFPIRPIVLAAGGTGGHLFGAEALARALIDCGVPVVLATDRRGHAFGNGLRDVRVERVRAASPGGGPIGRLRAFGELLLGYGQARGLLRALGPVAVVGFGGYASVPAVYAGTRLGLPVVVHEQNAVAGRANRWLARRARVIASGFPHVSGLRAADAAKVTVVGNPVRPAIAALRDQPYPAPTDDGPIHLLVFGGSQGARAFDEGVPPALASLPEGLRRRLVLSQQCRPEDLEQVKAAYAGTGIRRELAPFFRDMPERLARAHLVISRAGASTCAELTAAGRPAILVPYPHAADDHQAANARAMAEAGGAWVLPQAALTPSSLAGTIGSLLNDPRRLDDAAGAARRFGTVDAAARLAEVVLEAAGLRRSDGAAGQGAGAPVPSASPARVDVCREAAE